MDSAPRVPLSPRLSESPDTPASKSPASELGKPRPSVLAADKALVAVQDRMELEQSHHTTGRQSFAYPKHKARSDASWWRPGAVPATLAVQPAAGLGEAALASTPTSKRQTKRPTKKERARVRWFGVPCRDYLRGCPRGDECFFLHDPENLYDRTRDSRCPADLYRTVPCADFASDQCPWGDRCTFIHDPDNLYDRARHAGVPTPARRP
jgi:hypothetical protein